MRINPQAFFNFCSVQVPLLRQLAACEEDVSEADVRRLIRDNPGQGEQLLETIWRRLRELQIIVSVEPDSDFYSIAEPVRKLVAYLFDEAQATTPAMVRGCMDSLQISGLQLTRSIEQDDTMLLRLATEEIHQTLRRIHSDLDETHHCILGEIARYKTERRTVPVREKFQRIVRWMDWYVNPMVEIVRPDGPLRASFDETERLMQQAREHGMFNDPPALERGLRQLRFVQRHALRVFQQCRRELQPLYESLRRSSLIAEGAALALRSLEQRGLAGWPEAHTVASFTLRWQHVPSDASIERALRNVTEHPPEPAPVVNFSVEEETPADLLRRRWMDGLQEVAQENLPLTDLLGWLVQEHPERSAADILAGFTVLVFDVKYQATFGGGEPREYLTKNAILEAKPVRLGKA